MKSKYIVMPYVNPDTDGIVCSIALADFLSRTEHREVEAVMAGKMGSETEYLLQRFDIPYPAVIESMEDVKEIALVDTHHKAQLPEEFPYEKVRLIIDHHPGGDDQLFLNAVIDNRTVGAAASIVAEMYLEQDIRDARQLNLLNYAIISNTLNFKAPSTSDFDIRISNEISEICHYDDKVVQEMFAQKAESLYGDVKNGILADLKVFDAPKGRIGISQLEVYGLQANLDVAKIKEGLRGLKQEKHLDYCIFNGVDIEKDRSIVICSDEESAQIVSEIFGISIQNCCYVFDRILLRKTDFVKILI